MSVRTAAMAKRMAFLPFTVILGAFAVVGWITGPFRRPCTPGDRSDRRGARLHTAGAAGNRRLLVDDFFRANDGAWLRYGDQRSSAYCYRNERGGQAPYWHRVGGKRRSRNGAAGEHNGVTSRVTYVGGEADSKAIYLILLVGAQ